MCQVSTRSSMSSTKAKRHQRQRRKKGARERDREGKKYIFLRKTKGCLYLPLSLLLSTSLSLSVCLSLPQVQHRDLKAANVLLVADGDGLVAKICDFGSAKWRLALAATSTGDKGNTTAWSAPEANRTKKKAGVFTEALNVWSFGVLHFEII